ncbi:hypothetical protein SNOG_05321 [Parastagonospora nodorum SN15]|uniref:Uncharacterized protein n=1 Tax=Phaeosphaeria nodorum (strain SN15 / ATCC MYA-4574 / FGSC 10173) TaxID=321614 RepID=Q0USE3_PHANO|nr:hypothetical protein SNOG_05321 [Parastagonospora nodorum SN15]EAT87712.1 hypothetical protein SNOG_05321 [Parastagonospora nodorum SN15]
MAGQMARHYAPDNLLVVLLQQLVSEPSGDGDDAGIRRPRQMAILTVWAVAGGSGKAMETKFGSDRQAALTMAEWKRAGLRMRVWGRR